MNYLKLTKRIFMIYLDYAASTPLDKIALKALQESLVNDFANPSSSHKLGKSLAKKIETYRQFFLDSVKSNGGFDFIFTSSATESNNTIIQNYKNILLSFADHASITKVKHNEINQTEFLLLKDGPVDIETLKQQLSSKHIDLIILSHVNNQSGLIINLEEIIKEIKSVSNCHIHIDASQSFGKFEIDLSKIKADSMAIASHKLGGPKGIAGLFFKKDALEKPLIYGGGQEGGLRSSTAAYPLIYSFYLASKEAISSLKQNFDVVSKINEKVRQELKGILQFPFKNSICSPYILLGVIDKISSDIILRHLESKDIYISSTSACSSKIKGDNPVFTSLKIDKKYHKNILRISFGKETTMSEIKLFCCEFKKIIEDLSFLLK